MLFVGNLSFGNWIWNCVDWNLVDWTLDLGENCVVSWTSCHLETGFGTVLIVANLPNWNLATVSIVIHLLLKRYLSFGKLGI